MSLIQYLQLMTLAVTARVDALGLAHIERLLEAAGSEEVAGREERAGWTRKARKKREARYLRSPVLGAK